MKGFMGSVSMSNVAKQAAAILKATALSYDDVLPHTTIELTCEQFSEAANFLRSMVDDGKFLPADVPEMLHIADNCESLTQALLNDPLAEVTYDGSETRVYLAAADHLNVLVDLIRSFELLPEWTEYYNDIARKLAEYSEALRKDPHSSFRAI